ncbi:MAG: acyl carrier protein [Gemmatimonadaceae bacterium]
MDDTTTVHRRLEDVFRTVFNNDDITLRHEMTAAEVPGWDSLEHVNVMFAIESEFGVRFGPTGLAAFENFGALERFIEERER